jgi:hypothetical protein
MALTVAGASCPGYDAESRGMVFYALAAWLVMMPFAIANGIIRQSFLVPRLGERGGHVVSTLVLSAFVFFFAAVFLWLIPDGQSFAELLTVSLTWVTATVLFEFAFGHYVMRAPWERLLADYNIFGGRIWSLVLLSQFVAPIAVGSLAGL